MINLYQWLCNHIKPRCLRFLVILSICFAIPNLAKANHEVKAKDDFVMEHIGDAYAWHIATIGHVHVSIPLPIILISSKRGIEIFSSTKLLNDHQKPVIYKGYFIDKHHHIRHTDPSFYFYDLSITKHMCYVY
jgi:F-type H+-transporting ATPase subunit a